MRRSAHAPIHRTRKTMGFIAPANSTWNLPDDGVDNPGGGPPDNPTDPVDPGDPPPEPPASGIIDMIDYLELPDDTAGRYFQGNLSGDGRLTTTYRLTASTKADEVARYTQGQTNQYRGMFFGKTGTPFQPTLTIEDFTVDMSDVPHNTNGIAVGYVADLTVNDVGVLGCRGSTSSPPGETFAFSAWHILGGTINGLILDGRDRFGNIVGSTLFGINSAGNLTLNACKFNYSKYGFGIANWKGTGTNVFNQPDLRWNRRAVNHEQCLGTWTYNQPDCRNSIGAGGTGYRHFVMNGTLGSAELYIDEPDWDRTVNGANNPFRVGVYTGSKYSVTGGIINQLASDVHVKIDGDWYTGPINNSLLSIGPY